MSKHVCDRCKREISEKEPASKIQVTYNREMDSVPSTENICMCPECTDAFIRFKFMLDSLNPLDEAENEVHANGRKHVDYGRIISLYREGCTIGQIAEEMDTTKCTVAWAISNYRQRNGNIR